MTIPKRPDPNEVQRSRDKLIRFGIDWLSPKTMNVMDYVAAGVLCASIFFVKNKQDVVQTPQTDTVLQTANSVDSTFLKPNSSETATYKPPSP